MILFLAPHNDDETLFGAYSLLALKRYAEQKATAGIGGYHPFVLVVFRAITKGDWITREAETHAALYALGAIPWTQWDYSDRFTLTLLTAAEAEVVDRLRAEYEDTASHVYAPAVEDGGHEQHSFVGRCALAAFGAHRVTHYLTYRRGHGRSESKREVRPVGDDADRKRAALDCYQSQIKREDTAVWFGDDQREFLA